MTTQQAIATGIDTIFLEVADTARSVRFYREALGVVFDVDPDDGSASARVGDANLVIHSDLAPRQGKRGDGVTVYFAVADGALAFDEFRLRGLEPSEEEPVEKPWGLEFTIKDPDGYHLAFVEKHAR